MQAMYVLRVNERTEDTSSCSGGDCFIVHKHLLLFLWVDHTSHSTVGGLLWTPLHGIWGQGSVISNESPLVSISGWH